MDDEREQVECDGMLVQLELEPFGKPDLVRTHPLNRHGDVRAALEQIAQGAPRTGIPPIEREIGVRF